MVEFKTNINDLLPYDREQYLNFLDDGFQSSTEWKGVSLQFSGEKNKSNFDKYVDYCNRLFMKVILKFDKNHFWILNHDDKDIDWFSNNRTSLPQLRSLFQNNNVQNTFRGALTFYLDDILKYSKELISYPFEASSRYGLLYKNLDISHVELQFVIKVTGHWSIDFISTDKELIKKIVTENDLSYFRIVKYRNPNSV